MMFIVAKYLVVSQKKTTNIFAPLNVALSVDLFHKMLVDCS